MYIKYIKNNSHKNLFFNFLFYNTFAKLDRNILTKKKLQVFFELESLVDKATLNFQSFKKINDFVTTQYATTIFYPFYLNT